MKEFEKVYEELIKKYEGNADKAFATEIYEAGRNVSFTQNLKDAVKNDKMAIKLMSFTAITMAERSIKMNAADMSVSTEVEMEHMRYFTRLSSITFRADKKPLEKRAHEIAKNIFRVKEINSLEDVQAMLEEAVLAGYNLRKEDFEED